MQAVLCGDELHPQWEEPLSDTIRAWVHRVVVFSVPAPEGKKVKMHVFLSPKVWLVRDWFAEDHPGQTIVKLFSLGTFEAEMDRKKYNALREQAETVQKGIRSSKSAW